MSLKSHEEGQWECPHCGYRVTGVHYFNVIINHSCPRCRLRNLTEFNRVKGDPEPSPAEALEAPETGKVTPEPSKRLGGGTLPQETASCWNVEPMDQRPWSDLELP